ncbi:MAG: FkbM family methyltransferase [Rhodospirillales bacterium]|nr:FkbM family methyltransferase [Rhodospirillales bacterium]
MTSLWRRVRAAVLLSAKIHHRALYNWLKGEPELRAIKYLCDPTRSALDVGANVGIYTYFLRRHARRCYAIEPNPMLIDILRQSFGDSVEILPLALSDKIGPTRLRLPTIDGISDHGRATIEDANRFDGYDPTVIDTSAARLDDLDIDSVGFIKIDVEGHEMAVLNGGRTLLERDRPVLLIESEERHKTGALGELFGFLDHRGYRAYFHLDGRFQSTEIFDAAIHQRPDNVGDYGVAPGRTCINNFLLVPNGSTRDRLAAQLGLSEPR